MSNGGLVQNTVSQYPNTRYEGQVDKATVGSNQGRYILKDGNVGFGLAVVQGANDDEVISPTATGQQFRGVTVRNLDVNNNDSNVANYEQDKPITFRNMGYITVLTEVAVTKDDAAYFRHTASGGNTTIGAWRNDADTATADAVTGAFFNESAGAGELVELCLPNFY